MKTTLRLSLILLPLAFAPACDSEDDKDSSSKSDKDNDDDDDDDQVPLWDCYCEAECDGDVLTYEEEVCSDADTIDLAVEVSVEACGVELEEGCVEFFCGCECDEDPDLACG